MKALDILPVAMFCVKIVNLNISVRATIMFFLQPWAEGKKRKGLSMRVGHPPHKSTSSPSSTFRNQYTLCFYQKMFWVEMRKRQQAKNILFPLVLVYCCRATREKQVGQTWAPKYISLPPQFVCFHEYISLSTQIDFSFPQFVYSPLTIFVCFILNFSDIWGMLQ